MRLRIIKKMEFRSMVELNDWIQKNIEFGNNVINIQETLITNTTEIYSLFFWELIEKEETKC